MAIPNLQTDLTATPASTRTYLIPFILVTSLFFLWGLANILNSALIAHFQPVFDISRPQALFIETGFYTFCFAIVMWFRLKGYRIKALS